MFIILSVTHIRGNPIPQDPVVVSVACTLPSAIEAALEDICLQYNDEPDTVAALRNLTAARRTSWQHTTWTIHEYVA